MARISKIFDLNKSQFELDFVDVDIHRDKPVFLNPFFLSTKSDAFSTSANRTIKSFFQHNLELIRANELDQAKSNFIHLNEPNETCLGLSSGRPRGRGIGKDNAGDLFDSISASEAVRSGLLEDLEDTAVFIDGIGRDKVSDMTTNLIRQHLIKYTQDQCRIHGIPLTPGVPSGFFWDPINKKWENSPTERLIIYNRAILLIPKGIVSFSTEYTPSKYRQHFALTFLQEDHIRRGTSLVKKRYDKKGELKEVYVLKKDVEPELPPSKTNLHAFTMRHPDVFKKFRTETAENERSLTNTDIGTDQGLNDVVEYLIAELEGIPPGNENGNAQKYHKLMFGVLELIFYPNLINPIKEKEIDNGRKRVDIVFDNGAPRQGFFHRLQNAHRVPCQYIFVECKNYSDDIANEEIDQMMGRFSINKGKFGIIVCRNITNMPLLIRRCKDTYTAGQGLIVPLTDRDIISILRSKASQGEESHPEEDILDERIREIIL
jgi:hypothetical protein